MLPLKFKRQEAHVPIRSLNAGTVTAKTAKPFDSYMYNYSLSQTSPLLLIVEEIQYLQIYLQKEEI